MVFGNKSKDQIIVLVMEFHRTSTISIWSASPLSIEDPLVDGDLTISDATETPLLSFYLVPEVPLVLHDRMPILLEMESDPTGRHFWVFGRIHTHPVQVGSGVQVFA